jgi:hypothetical protein
MTLRVLTAHGRDAATWQSYADRLALDVTLTPAYARVQEQIEGEAVCLVYDQGCRFYMWPMLLLENETGHDAKSFYGGMGPAGDDCDGAISALNGWFSSHVVCYYMAQIDVSPLEGGTMKKSAVVVDIAKDDAALMQSFSRNRRRELQSRAEIEVWDEMNPDLFCNMYDAAMKRKEASQHWQFSRSYWVEHVAQLGDEHCVFLNANDKAMLLVVFGYGKAHAHFIGGPPQYHDRLYFEAMRFARDAGCTQFYLGGGLTDSVDDPLLQYKLSFSKRTVPVYEYRRIFDQDAYDKLAGGSTGAFFPPWRAAA